MTHDVTLAWHRLRFELKWIKLSGLEFQGFLEKVMAKLEPDFIPVLPSGSEGDRKSDGYVPSKSLHLQAYAPPTGINAAKTIEKINEDFRGLIQHWPDTRYWAFVWNTPRGGLPPQVIERLGELKAENLEVEIEPWGMETLWQRVRDLSEQDRNDLLGLAPGMEGITRIDSADVLSMLNSLADQPIPAPDTDFTLVEIGEKMARNGLGDGVRLLLTAAYGLVPTVQNYLNRHPDPAFSERISQALKDLYASRAEDLADSSDALFGSMVEAIATPATPASPRYWAAAAIVGHSFELCDIFER